jgi:hypothetical protein
MLSNVHPWGALNITVAPPPPPPPRGQKVILNDLLSEKIRYKGRNRILNAKVFMFLIKNSFFKVVLLRVWLWPKVT